MDNTGKFTEEVKSILEKALDIAGELGGKYVGSEHLLLGILWVDNSIAAKVLTAKGITYLSVKKTVSSFEKGEIRFNLTPSDITPMAKNIISSSSSIAELNGHGKIGSEHILLAILENRDCVAVRIILMHNVSIGELKTALRDYEHTTSKSEKRSEGQQRGKNQTFLSKYGKNLCSAAREGMLDPVMAREKEIERMMGILCRRTKNNPCLVGEPGVGKTAVVEGLAQCIVKKEVPKELWQKEIYTLELSSMIAGAKYRGDFEERMKGIIDEAKNNSDIVLFIDEIHTIMGAGSAEGAMDAANIIKPALARGQIQVIGATTYKEYQKHIEKDGALERRFQVVKVDEPSEEQAKQMLYGLLDRYAKHHNVIITDQAVEKAVELSKIYLPDKYLPDKAIDLIDEACANKRLINREHGLEKESLSEVYNLLEAKKEEAVLSKNFRLAIELTEKQNKIILEKKRPAEQESLPTVNGEDIERVIYQKTGIQPKLNDGMQRLAELEKELREAIVGQDEAIGCVVNSIRRGKTGMKSNRKPVGSFLFIGQSGVGKTELALEMGNKLFDCRGSIIRLDMSEYMEKHSVSRLIGSPPGYVGYEEMGQLTSHVRKYPNCLVLFDEIEKAHKDVLSLLLQILDCGKLTDSTGKVADFRNCVIVMTSNVGANKQGFAAIKGFYQGEEKEREADVYIKEELKRQFCSELLNRIDEIIIFNSLSEESIIKITKRSVGEAVKKAERVGLEVEVDEGMIHYIVNKCMESRSGGRDIKRWVTRLIEDKIAEVIISSGAFFSGKLRLFLEGEEVRYSFDSEICRS